MAEPVAMEKRGNRRDDDLTALFELIKESQRTQTQIQKSVNHVSSQLIEHMNREEVIQKANAVELQRISAEMLNVNKMFSRAFVKNENGEIDVDGHHNFHFELVKDSKFWDRVKSNAAEKVVTAILLAIILIFGLGVKDYVSKFFVPQTEAVQKTAPKLLGGEK